MNKKLDAAYKQNNKLKSGYNEIFKENMKFKNEAQTKQRRKSNRLLKNIMGITENDDQLNNAKLDITEECN